MLLIHLGPDPHWLRFSEGQVSARGHGLPAPAPGTRIIAAVPGEDVSLHWVDLPALAPAQARAAARMIAADLGAGPAETTHIAVADGAGLRPVAMVAHDRMRGWLDRLADAGLVPDHVIPDMMLLPLPADGVSVAALPGRTLVRGTALAFVADPDLAPLLIGALHRHAATLEDDLGAALDVLALDLRQGEFALVQPWRPAPGLWRRLALMAAGAALLWAAGDLAAWWQAARAADAAGQKMIAAAAAVLPAGAVITADTARAQVAARVTALGADGGMTALAAPLADIVTAQPQASVASLDYAPATGLVAGLAASPAERDAVLAALGPGAILAGERRQGDTAVTDIRMMRR